MLSLAWGMCHPWRRMIARSNLKYGWYRRWSWDIFGCGDLHLNLSCGGRGLWEKLSYLIMHTPVIVYMYLPTSYLFYHFISLMLRDIALFWWFDVLVCAIFHFSCVIMVVLFLISLGYSSLKYAFLRFLSSIHAMGLLISVDWIVFDSRGFKESSVCFIFWIHLWVIFICGVQ